MTWPPCALTWHFWRQRGADATSSLLLRGALAAALAAALADALASALAAALAAAAVSVFGGGTLAIMDGALLRMLSSRSLLLQHG